MRIPALVFSVLFAGAAFAATPEQEAALKQIDAFATAQSKTDPLYRRIETQLLERVDEIIAKQPPAAWADTIRRAYFGIAEKAHSDERAEIRQIEQLATVGTGSPTDRYIDRLEALERDLMAGKLSPREHALHALEAARAVYPSDAHLIALREAKVPLATDYELGRISRVEYDAGWERAKAAYQQRAGDRERAMVEDPRGSQGALQRPAGPSLGDRIRQQRGITCTPVGNGMNCR